MSDMAWAWMSGSNTVNHAIAVYGQQGVPHANNVPGGRTDAVGWFANDTRELWLFGGYGCSSSCSTKG